VSLSGDRAELAELLDGVDDMTGFSYRSKLMRTGDAWPLIRQLDAEMAGAFQATWTIVVVLPAGEIEASKWFDAHHETITDGLMDGGFGVDRIEPAVIDTDAGDRDCMLFTVRREA
jgi:hypothetical protein